MLVASALPTRTRSDTSARRSASSFAFRADSGDVFSASCIGLARGAPTRFVGLTPPRGRWSRKHGQLRVGQRGRRTLRGHVRRRNVRRGRSDFLVRYDRKFLSLLRRRSARIPTRRSRLPRSRTARSIAGATKGRACRRRADRRLRSHERSQQRLTTGTVGKMPLNRGRRRRRQRTLDPGGKRFAVDALVRKQTKDHLPAAASDPTTDLESPLRSQLCFPCALRPTPYALSL